VPVTAALAAGLIARLAVDKRYTQRGFGEWLLIDALKKLLAASDTVGFPLIVVDAKEGAVGFYEKAVALEPDDLRSRENLGVVLVRLHQYNRALDQFQEIIKRNPDAADAHYNLGVIYSDYLFDRKKAIEHYLRYAEVEPNSEERAKVLAWVKELQEQ